ncbi:MAG: hypothetical protein GTO24_28180 [candidate division Zixibacteria bacterium]|nr:hypothetical protein [candidate division Zixibacteria bacterium]
MSKKQMICLALVALFLFVLGAHVRADSSQYELECLPEQPSLISPERGDSFSGNRYGIPRKQVLLEITTATW